MAESLPLFDQLPEAVQAVPVHVSRENARRSRNESFANLEPKAGTRRAEVLAVVRAAGRTGVTRQELAKQLNWPINAVTGRVTELRDQHELIVEPGDQRQGVKGNNVLYAKEVLA